MLSENNLKCVIRIFSLLFVIEVVSSRRPKLCESSDINIRGHQGVKIEPFSASRVEMSVEGPGFGAARTDEMKFQFKSNGESGILFYGSRDKNNNEMIVLRLRGGYLHYSMRCSIAHVHLRVPTDRLDDGMWHTVKFFRGGYKGYIEVDKKIYFQPYRVNCGGFNYFIFGGVRPEHSDRISVPEGKGNHFDGCVRNVDLTVSVKRHISYTMYQRGNTNPNRQNNYRRPYNPDNHQRQETNPAVKILFQILQCLHHASVISKQVSGSPTRGFISKISDLNRFVKPALKNSAISSAIETVNSVWAKNVSIALKNHYDSQLAEKISLIKARNISESNFKQFTFEAINWAKKSYRRLQKDALDQFDKIIDSFKDVGVVEDMEAESQPVSTPNRHQLPLIADVRPTPKRKRTPSPSGLSTSQEPLSISKKPHTHRRTLPLPTFTATPSIPMTTPRSNPETPKPQRTNTRRRLSLTTSPSSPACKPRRHNN
ncbi:hypothetical protein LOTGIDRAFT_229859 [Lottia gigantea]|uniref:Laminin G domain-containing protein n=1 Tax=Lottia gigantea TaxID=225164 RepID=V4B3F1_LOTGI|nr:hypothetical protein LOTGIDRAFT_229859 [Lottia gigantea]ESO82874.1 hypothetical protein LOTGIDRAFT_229859 [Lottia gigantea]